MKIKQMWSLHRGEPWSGGIYMDICKETFQKGDVSKGCLKRRGFFHQRFHFARTEYHQQFIMVKIKVHSKWCTCHFTSELTVHGNQHLEQSIIMQFTTVRKEGDNCFNEYMNWNITGMHYSVTQHRHYHLSIIISKQKVRHSSYCNKHHYHCTLYLPVLRRLIRFCLWGMHSKSEPTGTWQ